MSALEPDVASQQSVAGLRPLRDELTDLPNVITLIRIAMIPVILIFIDNYSPKLSAISAMIFAVAAASDALDGYLARRLGLVTVVGKFLDPLADKLIVLSVLVFLVAKGRAPAWLVVVLMSRELAITGLRAIASQRGLVIAAGAGGKAKTAMQLVGLVLLLIHFPFELLFTGIILDTHRLGMYLLYASLVISVLSAAQYFQFFARAASEQAEHMAQQGLSRARLKDQARRRRAKLRGIKRARRREKIQHRRDRIASRRERKARVKRRKTKS